jgi:hypothetical protein
VTLIEDDCCTGGPHLMLPLALLFCINRDKF